MDIESDRIKTQQNSAAENVNCGLSLLTAGGLGDKQNSLSWMQLFVNLFLFTYFLFLRMVTQPVFNGPRVSWMFLRKHFRLFFFL